MFERFDQVARRVLFFARYEASELGSETIAPEHILLGIIREEKGRAWEVLSKGKLSAEDLSEAIKEPGCAGRGRVQYRNPSQSPGQERPLVRSLGGRYAGSPGGRG